MSQSQENRSSFLNSFRGACQGIFHSLKTEKHLRFHLFAAFLVIVSGVLLKFSRLNWLLLTYAIGSVITAELFNTAVERVIDLVQPGYHPLAGAAKDIASGAVLVTAVQAVVIGIILFGPYFF
ncbi:MAG: Undecaprenol kinase [Candidatus Dichloromethanomonas elyunquensis]|nr:MAG: Undecaprenol kinase [Candidatus Dichloromethanomonas elyunquensis]